MTYRVFHGVPAGEEGGFALFEPGSLFGLTVEAGRSCRSYFCRWDPARPNPDLVPGIERPVEVLCFAPNRTKLGKLRRLLQHLEALGCPLAEAPDGFFGRLNGLVEDSRTTLRSLRHLVRMSFPT